MNTALIRNVGPATGIQLTGSPYSTALRDFLSEDELPVGRGFLSLLRFVDDLRYRTRRITLLRFIVVCERLVRL